MVKRLLQDAIEKTTQVVGSAIDIIGSMAGEMRRAKQQKPGSKVPPAGVEEEKRKGHDMPAAQFQEGVCPFTGQRADGTIASPEDGGPAPSVTDGDANAAPKSATKPAASSDATSAAKADASGTKAKPAAKSAASSDTKPAAKAESKPAAKPAAKAESKPAAKSAAKTEAKAPEKSAAKADAKPATKASAKPAAKKSATPKSAAPRPSAAAPKTVATKTADPAPVAAPVTEPAPAAPKKSNANTLSDLGDLSAKSRDELYEIAQEFDVRGRKNMRKSQLIAAIEEHLNAN